MKDKKRSAKSVERFSREEHVIKEDKAYSGRIDGKVHKLPARVYYEDTDMSGVVYHANYLRFFERGRSDFLRKAGIIHTELQMREKALAFAVISIDIKFKKPAKIDDSLLIQTQYTKISGAKLFVSQSITRDDEVLTTADVVAICIDFNGKPQRPPKELFDGFLPYLMD